MQTVLLLYDHSIYLWPYPLRHLEFDCLQYDSLQFHVYHKVYRMAVNIKYLYADMFRHSKLLIEHINLH